MEHWIDTLSRRLADRPISRRRLLTGTLRAGLAAAGASLFGLGQTPVRVLAQPAQTYSRQDVDKGVTCSVTSSNRDTTVYLASVSGRGGQLILDETMTTDLPQLDQGSRTFARDLSIALNGAMLYRQTVTGAASGPAGNSYAPTSYTMTVEYGDGFYGVQNASFTSDGTTIQGSVDGRAIRPFPVSATSGRMVYQNGQPVPPLVVRPDIGVAIEEIAVKASLEAPECFAAFDPPDCGQCQQNCFTSPFSSVGSAISTGGQVAACIFSFGISCVASGVAAIASLNDCENNCFQPGGSCCVVSCEFGCCPDGYVCSLIGPGTGYFVDYAPTCCQTGIDSSGPGGGNCPFDEPGCTICCPQGYGTACGGTCCFGPCCKGVCCEGGACTSTDGICCLEVNGKPVTSCKGNCCSDPDDVCTVDGVCCPPLQGGPNPPISCNGTCCPNANDICVGSGCCPAGAPVCDDGTCCPSSAGTCLNGTCCELPNTVCGTTCCGGFNACCNDVCCADGDVCAGGVCCPQDQACGSACCSPGQYCQDASTGTCSACPTGTNGTICHNSTGTSSACCEPSSICCQNQCCPESDQNGVIVCCQPVNADVAPYNNSTYGCHHSFACTA